MNKISLATIRSFYGEENTRELSRALQGTPIDQLWELADRILDEASRPDLHFGRVRQGLDLIQGITRDSIIPYVHDVTTIEWNRGNTRLDIPNFKHLLLYCERSALPDPIIGWAALAHKEAKYYNSRRETNPWGNELARTVLRLAPLEGLINLGAILLYPPFHCLGTDSGSPRSSTYGDPSLTETEHDLDFGSVIGAEASELADSNKFDDPDAEFWNHFSRRHRSRLEAARWHEDFQESISFSGEVDRYSLQDWVDLDMAETWWHEDALHRFVIDECRKELGWELEALELDDRDPGSWGEIISIVTDRHLESDPDYQYIAEIGLINLADSFAKSGLNLSARTLQDLVQFSVFCEYGKVIPVCGSTGAAEMVSLIADPRSPGRFTRKGDIALPPGVQFGIPALTEVSLADVISLRMNEPVFAEVRSSLLSLQSACASEAHMVEWHEYQRRVALHSQEIIGPVHARLQRQIRRDKRKGFIIGQAASSFINLGIHGLSTLAGAPAAGRIGSPLGRLIGKMIASKWAQPERDIAATILLSLMHDSEELCPGPFTWSVPAAFGTLAVRYPRRTGVSAHSRSAAEGRERSAKIRR